MCACVCALLYIRCITVSDQMAKGYKGIVEFVLKHSIK